MGAATFLTFGSHLPLHESTVQRHRGVQWTVVLVISVRLVVLTIVMGSFNLAQAAVSAPRPDPARLRRYRRLARDFV
jgi:hypothetical protein